MNNRQRSKQASYAEKYDARALPNKLQEISVLDIENGEEESSNYVAPAKQPSRKLNDVKGDAQCQRIRTEPKFHKEKSNKVSTECKDEGRVKNFKSLDDIPDYDEVGVKSSKNNRWKQCQVDYEEGK